MERINRRTWRASETLSWFGKLEGFIDPGEQACFAKVAAEACNQPVLDLGVGGGRTTSLLLELTSDYVGIDYTPEMIAICRRKFPGVRLDEADARDLSAFASGSMQLVTFSFNGIDAVDADGRRRILAEVHRVLRPGGAFFFSTINQQGPDFRGPPHLGRTVRFTLNPLRLGVRVLRYLIGNAVGATRLLLNRGYEERGEGHAILLHNAHDFGILVYATSLRELRAQVSAAGFAPDAEIIGATSGKPVTEASARDEAYFQVIARKPHD